MNKKVLGVSSATLALLIVTSVFAAAAEPGNFLYQYKVHVNDRINGWFAVEYVADVDDHIDMIEDRLSEIDSLIASGTITPSQAVELRNNLINQIESATRIVDSNNTTLTATQVKRLKDGLDRMKDALARYSATLQTLDEIAAEDPEEKKKRKSSGKSKRTYDAVVDVIETIEDEIVEAIDELEQTESNETVNDTTASTTEESIIDEEHTDDDTEISDTDETPSEDHDTATEDLPKVSEDFDDAATDTEEATDSSIETVAESENESESTTEEVVNES